MSINSIANASGGYSTSRKKPEEVDPTEENLNKLIEATKDVSENSDKYAGKIVDDHPVITSLVRDAVEAGIGIMTGGGSKVIGAAIVGSHAVDNSTNNGLTKKMTSALVKSEADKMRTQVETSKAVYKAGKAVVDYVKKPVPESTKKYYNQAADYLREGRPINSSPNTPPSGRRSTGIRP